MVIRIMRDLCNRVPTWGPLNPWVSMKRLFYDAYMTSDFIRSQTK